MPTAAPSVILSLAANVFCGAALLLPAAGRQQDSSQRAQTADALSRQQAAQRADEAARQPEVVPGLRLPDESGVWGLDQYRGLPELVRIAQGGGDVDGAVRHSVRATAIPLGGARPVIRVDRAAAAVAFHTLRPTFYIALDLPREIPAREDAMRVDTHAAASAMPERAVGAPPRSRYALVRLHVLGIERVAMAAALRPLEHGGDADASAQVIAMHIEVLPGGHWMRATPAVDLEPGQYSLVELLETGEWNADGWDFGVAPGANENRGVRVPLQP